MKKARLVPLYFRSGKDKTFTVQVEKLRELLAEAADILESVALGDPLPDAEAVVFP